MSNVHDVQAKDAERAKIDDALSVYLSQGKMIEVLTSDAPSRAWTNYNQSTFKESKRG